MYRRPIQPNEYLLSYFGSKDIGIAHISFPRFSWTDNLLWKEDIRDHPVTVVLARRDGGIDTKAIRAHLLRSDNWALETTDLIDLGRKDDRLYVIWSRFGKGRNHYIHSTLGPSRVDVRFLGNYKVDVAHIRPEWNGCTHVDL
ncbi:Uncharacterized protein HZ326_30188 [Fusarium oxysporum f. sp. albedinis]|nr:Uncharacterized protein HZ326_30188 [Fusarium oxysporum f. sp. albedinis]